MLILNRLQVEALLDVDALIDALAPAMADLSAGRASVPDRVAALVPEHEGFLAAMPGFVPSAKVLMSKLVSLFPHNAGTGRPTHQAVIVAFDPDSGQPVALLDGTAITAIRTGACSALSARLLARPTPMCWPSWEQVCRPDRMPGRCAGSCRSARSGLLAATTRRRRCWPARCRTRSRSTHRL
jgi:ornithine cyclodeaminase